MSGSCPLCLPLSGGHGEGCEEVQILHLGFRAPWEQDGGIDVLEQYAQALSGMEANGFSDFPQDLSATRRMVRR